MRPTCPEPFARPWGWCADVDMSNRRGVPIPFAARAAFALQDEAAGTPIEVGELEVVVNVQVVYGVD